MSIHRLLRQFRKSHLDGIHHGMVLIDQQMELFIAGAESHVFHRANGQVGQLLIQRLIHFKQEWISCALYDKRMEFTVILVAQNLALSAHEVPHVLLKSVCIFVEFLHVHFPVLLRAGIACDAFNGLARLKQILDVVFGKIKHIVVFILAAVDHALDDQAAGSQPFHRFTHRCTGNIQFVCDLIDLQFAAGAKFR